MNLILDLPADCLGAPKIEHLHRVAAMMAYPHDAASRGAYEVALASGVNYETKRTLARTVDCIGAGWMLMEAIGRNAHQERDAKMYSIMLDLRTVVPKLKPKHIKQKIWRDHRSVAHLGAAFLSTAHDYGPPQSGAFPCELVHLPAFLVKAEVFRIQGEQRKFPRRRETILRSGDTVRLPPGLESVILSSEVWVDPAFVP